jgi:hypothetical protein
MMFVEIASALVFVLPRGVELDGVQPLERSPGGGEETDHGLGKSMPVRGPHAGFHDIVHFITPCS